MGGAKAQYQSSLPQKAWVDSVFKSLTPRQKIAQLMIIRAHSNLGPDHVAGVQALIAKYNVGALCFFQGGPVRQANLTNLYQSTTQTPLLVTIDGEWGLGMRLDSVARFPYQATLGAVTDTTIVYGMGEAVGRQMKRIGVHVNYAPDIDVNNNPNNPVIGFRSFGEKREQVALLGVAYMRGMQAAGIMATAKHFPGHGDTETDSHLDLPVINKTKAQLDSLELYPFRELIKAGVGSVMVAHLFIPSIDNRPNRPTSLSKAAIAGMLRDELGYKGLIFTDGMEMKGITKFFPAGEAAVQALIAGNDMLCLPDDVPAAISAVEGAIKKKKLRWKDIDERLYRVLEAKYNLGLNKQQFVNTTNLLADLNAETAKISNQVAKAAFTVLRNDDNVFPAARLNYNKKLAYVGIGVAGRTHFGTKLRADLGADTFYFAAKATAADAENLLKKIDTAKYAAIIIGMHNYSLRPANNFGLSAAALKLWEALSKDTTTATVLFGNAYAARNFCTARNLAAAYQDDSITHEAVAAFMSGGFPARGKLPVTVCGFSAGAGIAVSNMFSVGFAPQWLAIDSIVRYGLERRAYPGAQVIVLQKGRIRYHKTFGRFEFDEASQPVQFESIYDLASVTKTSATTVAVMKLTEEGKIDLDKTLGDYLPIARGTDKEGLKLRDILLHQAGLNPFIQFYKETIDPTGKPSDSLYRNAIDANFTIPVARNLYLRNDWNDTMLLRIMQSKLGPAGKYVYSDNDFILLGKIVEAVSGQRLNQYTYQQFYKPMGMTTTSFRAGERYGVERVVPTENEKWFRRQMLRGTVHDEGAALFGGISGHAGLFSNAYDLASLYQMLLQGGEWNGKQYLKPETIALFTGYGSDISRRGLGFDKPEKDNATRHDPYPASMVSLKTFGHTGFTGTCVWVDPDAELVYIFLSNRVYNTRDNNLLSELRIRAKVQDAIYRALQYEQKGQPEPTVQHMVSY